MFVRDLVTIEDLTTQQIIDVLDLAQEIKLDIYRFKDFASGYLMANLFMEPSTRTLGSFESAMKRMGGQTITITDMKSSSMGKGETLADTIRTWSGYADLLTLRHPWEGSAKLAAGYSDVPVINAGDGSHEHPTQTLCDLFTLREEHGTLDGLRVVMCGDLKNGRTVHSLIFALLRFDAQIIFVPGERLDLPDHIVDKITTEYNSPLEKIDPETFDLSDVIREMNKGGNIDSIYATHGYPRQLDKCQSDASLRSEKTKRNLVLYMTRRQNERDRNFREQAAYPKVDASVMRRKSLAEAIVMHPLPRIDEISTELDVDPRSRYFQQARNGVPVRMALIALLLKLKPWSQPVGIDGMTEIKKPEGKMTVLVECLNQECVTKKEPQSVNNKLVISTSESSFINCKYCGQLGAFSNYTDKDDKENQG